MLKALFFRKRTAITYKTRIDPKFSDVDNEALSAFADDEDSRPGTKRSSQQVDEHVSEQHTREDHNIIEKDENMETDQLLCSPAKPNDLFETFVNNDSLSAPADTVDGNEPDGLPELTKLIPPSRKDYSTAHKRKRIQATVNDNFDIFDFPDAENDATVELMKAQPAAIFRKATSESISTQATKMGSKDSSSIKTKSSKKLIARLKAGRQAVINTDDESLSELSDFEPYTDSILADVSNIPTAKPDTPVSDFREAELSAFMRQEFGMETDLAENKEEQQQKSCQRRPYVPQNKIKASFTYGSSRKENTSREDQKMFGNGHSGEAQDLISKILASLDAEVSTSVSSNQASNMDDDRFEKENATSKEEDTVGSVCSETEQVFALQPFTKVDFDKDTSKSFNNFVYSGGIYPIAFENSTATSSGTMRTEEKSSIDLEITSKHSDSR